MHNVNPIDFTVQNFSSSLRICEFEESITVEPLYCGRLGDLVKSTVKRGVLISRVSFTRGSTI